MALAPYVQRGPGAESGCYTEASPTKRVPSRETSTCSPGLHIYYGKNPEFYEVFIHLDLEINKKAITF